MVSLLHKLLALSLDHFLLNESIFVELLDMLTRVDFELASLRERHDETTAEAAEDEHAHYAEVE